MDEATLDVLGHGVMIAGWLLVFALAVAVLIGACLAYYFGSVVGTGVPYKQWLVRRHGLTVDRTRLVLSTVIDAVIAVVMLFLVGRSTWVCGCGPFNTWWFKLIVALVATVFATTWANQKFLSGGSENPSVVDRSMALRLAAGPLVMFWAVIAPATYLLFKHVLLPVARDQWGALVPQLPL